MKKTVEMRIEMIRVLIISDTHGNVTNFDKVMPKVGSVDYLLHLGDVGNDVHYIETAAGCPCCFVAGNNDYFSDLPKERVVKIGGITIYMAHGHNLYVNFHKRLLIKAAKDAGASIAMFGHTHVPMIVTEKNCEENKKKYAGIDLINPGSLSLPRQADHIPTYIIMTISETGTVQYELCKVV